MLFIDEQIPHLAEIFSHTDGVSRFDGRALTREQLRRSRTTAIFVRSVTTVDAKLLAGTDVNFVGSATSGIDHVDTEYLESRNIRFASAPGCNANAVAEYVLDALEEQSVAPGTTIGIIGFGHVGSLLARYARALGYTVLVNDPPLLDSGASFPKWVRVASLNDLLATADVITLHVPLTEDCAHPTRDLITAELLATCKPGALVVNTARGGIIDEQALASRTAAGSLRAVLDVFANEPNIDPFVTERITRCTPHIAGYTVQAKERGALMVYEAYVGHPVRIRDEAELTEEQLAEQKPPTIIEPVASTYDHHARITPDTFDELRKTYPLRTERRTPPTWEELDALDA
jgi:erythronate-4-phosphate dehydrogenase